MNGFIESIQLSIENRNWHAAILTALCLPDICCNLQHGKSDRNKYREWFDRYVRKYYEPPFDIEIVSGEKKTKFLLNGCDCYALRCSVLHGGSDSILSQSARNFLNGFIFVAPPQGFTVHRNWIDGKLNLQVDLFCRDIVKGVLEWKEEMLSNNQKISGRIDRIMKIHCEENDGSFTVPGLLHREAKK